MIKNLFFKYYYDKIWEINVQIPLDSVDFNCENRDFRINTGAPRGYSQFNIEIYWGNVQKSSQELQCLFFRFCDGDSEVNSEVKQNKMNKFKKK